MKYTDEQIGNFLTNMNIDLLPYQREFVKKAINSDKIYITMPLMELTKILLSKERCKR